MWLQRLRLWTPSFVVVFGVAVVLSVVGAAIVAAVAPGAFHKCAVHLATNEVAVRQRAKNVRLVQRIRTVLVVRRPVRRGRLRRVGRGAQFPLSQHWVEAVSSYAPLDALVQPLQRKSPYSRRHGAVHVGPTVVGGRLAYSTLTRHARIRSQSELVVRLPVVFARRATDEVPIFPTIPAIPVVGRGAEALIQL